MLIEQRGSVRWLRLNRPRRLNALTPSLVERLDRAVGDAMSDPDTAAVVIAGEGKAFCAGADLAHLLEVVRDGGEPFGFLRDVSTCFTRIEHAPKPVVAAVHGHVVGGGLELALVCDLVVARAGTLVGDGHIRNGLLPAAGSSVRLPRKVGEPLARRMMLTGELLPAEDLVASGFVYELAPENDFEGAVTRAAEKAGSAGSPEARAAMKRLLLDRHELTTEDGLARELEVFATHWRRVDIAGSLARFSVRKAAP
ncbi:enoyl-CoA hydratase/isomerase family protein [Qaidamihabitans albus]|uniref:enoyl-CoA hydratase/isomerase family protein n=1 Tax=Qaidamihabitans albus TaxID=2795733 RepID=UPI0018F253D7|nr:enoyl-CoA hydratase/isomerase family protein [Qaidamihabitans albus]